MGLTKKSIKLLRILRKNYLKKSKTELTKSEAAFFGSSHSIHDQLCPKWNFIDVEHSCRELHRAGLLSCLYGDGIVSSVYLLDDGLLYKNNSFGDKLLTAIDFIFGLIAKFL